MFVFDEDSAKRIMTPWGKEVSKCLIDRNMKHSELLKKIRIAGYDIHKGNLSNLLYGVGVSARPEVVKEINRIT
ncbi:MAG: hypothetical protein A2Y15_05950 [Clostridiales bacterium GWF2_36_10]|nr:MAG: hypothetical protein A2Y15_05950 [Clostridiales bacterium GWF2_36_10]HAN21599.1 hypothetical protein [Clostridiales bacterium]